MSKLLQYVDKAGSMHADVLRNACESGMRKYDAEKALNKAVKAGKINYVGKGRPGPNRLIKRAQ